MIRIYNSLSGKKEIFKSINPNSIGLYVCGPTVSGESHLGHARPYITFDVVKRYFEFKGYKVKYVRNITDAGHFEEEGREAQDKVSERAKLEKLDPMELVQTYSNLFHDAMNLLNCKTPNIEPTATGHITEQISMINKIIDKGYAYVSNGSVYFDIIKYTEHYKYGELSGRVIEEQQETVRELEGQEEKRNKADFALWKKAPPKHLMRWESPWGEGFPGWHAECSAMSNKYLGEIFDIHGGGMDLKFPHHECEIAQSTIAYGHSPANYWVHNNMITINGKKMGKSYNNVIKLLELFNGEHPLLEQPYHPMVVRFYILQTHYRSTLDFSNVALKAAEKAFKRLWESYENLQNISSDSEEKTEMDNIVQKWCIDCEDSMDDDFNTAKVIGNLFELARIINGVRDKHFKLINASIDLIKIAFDCYLIKILGMKSINSETSSDKSENILKILLDIRNSAKKKRDYITSDEIRKKLEIIGVLLKDEKDGTVSYLLN